MDDDKIAKATLLKPVPYIRAPEAARPEAEGDQGGEHALWPSFTDPYRAAGNPAKNEIARLVVVLGKDGVKPDATARFIFQYPLLDLGAGGFTASGDQWFSFLWSGQEPRRIKVCGRNLDRICDYIALRRLPWVRLADRDFRPDDGVPDDEPVITHIEITELKD